MRGNGESKLNIGAEKKKEKGMRMIAFQGTGTVTNGNRFIHYCQYENFYFIPVNKVL